VRSLLVRLISQTAFAHRTKPPDRAVFATAHLESFVGSWRFVRDPGAHGSSVSVTLTVVIDPAAGAKSPSSS
jgi:hypothetical protein